MFLPVVTLHLSSVCSVCTQEDLARDPPGEDSTQAGVMMQPVTAWPALFHLENTSHLPPNPLVSPIDANMPPVACRI